VNRDSLERQLEGLFSDAALPAPAVSLLQSPKFVQKAPPQIKPPHPLRRLLPSNWQTGLTRVTESLGVVSIFGWVLVVAFTLMEHAGAKANPAATVPTAAVAQLSAATTMPTTPTAPTISAADPNALPANHTPTPTAVPATPSSTPTPTPTPTLAPVHGVYQATTTPASAEAIGLVSIPTPAPLVPMPEDAINIVLMGSDQRPYETQWRTDVIIIVSINPNLPSVSLLTIPRDTWLYIPNWTHQRINLADTHGALVGYPGGGPGLVKATIEYNFGIHVDYYARVDFAGLMRIVDTVGGIDVLLDCPVEDGFPDDPITEDPSVVTQISYPEPGLYHVDGKHALWLARSRKTTSEFARSRRQHHILEAIWNKANQLGLVTRLPELWDDLTATVQTDLSMEQVLWLASVGLQLDASKIQSGFIDGRYLTAWVSPGGANVLLPDTEAILEAVEPLFNPYPYQAPQGFSKVEVWNGSGHKNWGLLAADKLLRNGFEVTDIQPADTLYEHSVIFDFTATSKGSPLPLLQRLFDANVAHASAEARAEGTTAAFRLIVGADYQPCDWPTPPRWIPPPPTPTPTQPESTPEG
jgi:LCP family protein required for cell wall assembly